MQGTSFHPAHSSFGALNTHTAANAPRLQFARQTTQTSPTHHHHSLSPSVLLHADRLTITPKKPHESTPELQVRAQEAKDAALKTPHTPHLRKITTLAQKQGHRMVLNDFTLKRPHTGNWKRHEPVQLSDIKPGQVLIHNRTGKEIKVTSVLTPRLSEQQKRTNVQGKIVKTADGQTELRPMKVKTGYLFEFKGIVQNPGR